MALHVAPGRLHQVYNSESQIWKELHDQKLLQSLFDEHDRTHVMGEAETWRESSQLQTLSINCGFAGIRSQITHSTVAFPSRGLGESHLLLLWCQQRRHILRMRFCP